MQPAALTPEATQRAPQRRLDSPTRPARHDVGQVPRSFNWREFAQLFSSWLLPWLALISQLPFGSGNYADDFLSG
jgi:hypothetical protein